MSNNVPETPKKSNPTQGGIWGSDVIAQMLRAVGIPYIALNPGASFRGLHDSLVNHLNNTSPQILLCLHEESAVAIAHGYAKVTDKMMGAAVHSNVGLMHATMSIFNAWCDRAPMLVLGATGPVDAAKRRPWIDWIHTVADQGALIRDYTKWDNQPASVEAAIEAILRASQISSTKPCGPTFINLDSALQEAKLTEAPTLPNVSRYNPPAGTVVSSKLLDEVTALLTSAVKPVILAGRFSRNLEGWNQRIALAECLSAKVLTDLKTPAAFPTDHVLHPEPPGMSLTPGSEAMLREADVILALNWIDLAGTLKQAGSGDPIHAKIINISPDALVHRGWSMDHQGLPPADIYMMCDPDDVVPELLARTTPGKRKPSSVANVRTSSGATTSKQATSTISGKNIADALNSAFSEKEICITRLTIGWNGAFRHFKTPLDYIGTEGGGGIGAGPGITVGAALALKDTGRIPVAVMGDGDFLMGATAIWTATHYQIPCLIIVANNRSFYNDELHQERVAKMRSRPVENKWIGQRIDSPEIDIAMLARSQGAVGIGPVQSVYELDNAITRGAKLVSEGAVCVVDVRIVPGYES